MPTRVAERFEDVTQRGRLRVFQQNDGDMVVSIVPDPVVHPETSSLSVEFCTSGGKSPKTLMALLALMEAMAEDNCTNVHCSRRGERGLGVTHELIS